MNKHQSLNVHTPNLLEVWSHKARIRKGSFDSSAFWKQKIYLSFTWEEGQVKYLQICTDVPRKVYETKGSYTFLYDLAPNTSYSINIQQAALQLHKGKHLKYSINLQPKISIKIAVFRHFVVKASNMKFRGNLLSIFRVVACLLHR